MLLISQNFDLQTHNSQWSQIDIPTLAMHDERLCTLCEQGKIGDEFHALFECSFFNDVREELLPIYYKNPNTFNMDLLQMDIHRFLNEFMHLSVSKVSQ